MSIPKMFDLCHRASEGLGYVAGGGGIIVAAIGAADANLLQAWAGAIVAAVAALWGLWREQRSRDRKEEQAKKDATLHIAWDVFITDYRMKQIIATGHDPFARGTPPLDFLEHIELLQAGHEAPEKTDETASPKPEPKPEPRHPRWPKIVHYFLG
jgi:hypothetical protein